MHPPNLRILTPQPGVYAWYDGRVPGYRHAPQENWVDDGALSLGVASFALVEGDQALVYDTGTTLARGQAIRAHLESLAVRHLRIILSHWHKDHVAGTAAFGEVEVIANARSAAHLAQRRAEIEASAKWPPINPLVQPTTTCSGRMTLTLGARQVELIEMNIQSDDATILRVAAERLLLAGDTLEDPLTYVAEPEHLATHLGHASGRPRPSGGAETLAHPALPRRPRSNCGGRLRAGADCRHRSVCKLPSVAEREPRAEVQTA